MTFDTYLTSITRDGYVDKVVDTVLKSNVMTYRLLGNSKDWHGATLRMPIKVAKNTASGSFAAGDVFDTTRVNTRNYLSFDVRAAYQNVSIDGISLSVNATKDQVIDLVKTEMQNAAIDFSDSVGQMIYKDGTGNSNKDFLGLAAAIDDGSTIDTYGGLARTTTTYTGISGATEYPLKSYLLAASVNKLTLVQMAAVYDTISDAAERPTIITVNPTIFSLYESLNQPTVRNNIDGYGSVSRTGGFSPRGASAALKGEMGFEALAYRGTPLVKDKMTGISTASAQSMYFINEDYLEWYGLKHDNPKYTEVTFGTEGDGSIDSVYNDKSVHPNVRGFNWTGWKEPVNQDSQIAQFLLLGNLISNQSRRHGKLTGITGV